MMSDTTQTHDEGISLKYYRPIDSGEACKFDSFLAMLAQLRESHAGEYVAVGGGQVIAFGRDLDSVLKQAKGVVGTGSFYCGWIEPPGGHVLWFGSPSIL
jgi:hypothetical protein